MKQFVCKKCGSVDLFTNEKGSNTALYCSDCGAFQQNLNKRDKLIFEEYKKSLEPVKKISDNMQAMNSILNDDGSITSEIKNLIKNQKILIGLLIFIMGLMLILTFKFTFLDSKKLKNVEPQNTQEIEVLMTS